MSVGEAAAEDVAAEVEGCGVEGVGEGAGVGAFEAPGELVEAAAVDAEDRVGVAGQKDAEGVFIVAFDALAEFVFHACVYTSVANLA